MQRHQFANKGLYSQSYGFSSSYVLMWELDHKEGWVPKNQCFQIVLEKTLESPNQLINIGRSDAETESPIVWSLDTKSWLTGKDPDGGKDWEQEKKEVTGQDGCMA